jgi:hypothetical protein
MEEEEEKTTGDGIETTTPVATTNGRPCIFYAKTGSCRLGDKCRFEHHDTDETTTKRAADTIKKSTAPITQAEDVAMEALVAWIREYRNGRIIASDIGEFYEVRPDLTGRLGGRLQALCSRHADIIRMVPEGKSVFLEVVRSSPPPHKSLSAPTQHDVSLLVGFIKEHGNGKLRIADLPRLFQRSHYLGGVFAGRLAQACTSFPNLLRIRTDDDGEDWLELGDSAATTRSPSSAPPTSPVDFDHAVDRLVEWIRAKGGEVWASNVSQFYSDNPDLAGCFLRRMRTLGETHPHLIQVTVSPDGGGLLLKVRGGGDDGGETQGVGITQVEGVRVSADSRAVGELLAREVEDMLALDVIADARGTISLVQLNGNAEADKVLWVDVFSAGPRIWQDSGLKHVLEDPTIIKIMHDCASAVGCLFRAGVKLASVWDTKSACAVLVGPTHQFVQVAEAYEVQWQEKFPKDVAATSGGTSAAAPVPEAFTRPISAKLALLAARKVAHLVPLYVRMRQDAFSTDMLERCFQASTVVVKSSQAAAAAAAAVAVVAAAAAVKPAATLAKKRPPMHTGGGTKPLSGTEMLQALHKAGFPPDACYHFHIVGHCKSHPKLGGHSKYGPCKFVHEMG